VRLVLVDHYLLASQVDLLAEVFDAPRDKAHVLVAAFPRILDRAKIPHLMRCVPQDVQVHIAYI
jgi:hypothetical protein